jgi:hypothetical protein
VPAVGGVAVSVPVPSRLSVSAAHDGRSADDSVGVGKPFAFTATKTVSPGASNVRWSLRNFGVVKTVIVSVCFACPPWWLPATSWTVVVPALSGVPARSALPSLLGVSTSHTGRCSARTSAAGTPAVVISKCSGVLAATDVCAGLVNIGALCGSIA